MKIFSILFYLILFVYGKVRTKTIFNPLSLFSFSVFSTLISVVICEYLDLLRYASVQDIEHLYFGLLIGGIGFSCPLIIFHFKGLILEANTIEILHKNPFLFFGISSLVAVFIASYFLGSFPIFSMLNGTLNINELNENLKKLPLGILAIILNFEIVFFVLLPEMLFNKSKMKLWKYTFLFTLSFILCFWQGKRQMLLFCIFTFAVYFFNHVKREFSPKLIIRSILILFLFVFLFSQFGNIRNNISYEDRESNSELLEYAMYAPMNFATILNSYPKGGSTLFPNAILLEIIPNRFLIDSSKDYRNILFEPTSPSGYFAFWYMDYGYFGVFLGSFLLGFTSIYFYLKSNHGILYRRLNILTLWCCGTVGVYNHFISLNFFILPFIITFFISLKLKFKWQ